MRTRKETNKDFEDSPAGMLDPTELAKVIQDDAIGELAGRVSFSVATQFDPEARVIYILEEISSELVRRFLPTFNILDNTPGEIVVIISSGGGSISAGSVIYSALANASNPIITYGVGSVDSMASVILQAGDIRLLDENCRMLVHGGSTGFEGKVDAMNEYAVEAKRLTNWLRSVLIKRSGLPREEVVSMTSRETFLSAKEAVKKGLADKVIKCKTKKTPDFTKPSTKKRKKK